MSRNRAIPVLIATFLALSVSWPAHGLGVRVSDVADPTVVQVSPASARPGSDVRLAARCANGWNITVTVDLLDSEPGHPWRLFETRADNTAEWLVEHFVVDDRAISGSYSVLVRCSNDDDEVGSARTEFEVVDGVDGTTVVREPCGDNCDPDNPVFEGPPGGACGETRCAVEDDVVILDKVCDMNPEYCAEVASDYTAVPPPLDSSIRAETARPARPVDARAQFTG